MFRIIFFLFLSTHFIYADDYPKFFAELGTPLYKSDKAFYQLSHLINAKNELQAYHEQAKFLLHLSTNIKADKTKRKMYIQGLRLLEKKQKKILLSLNTVLLHSIDKDDYQTFSTILESDLDAILEIPVIRKRSMAYYLANRTRGKIEKLDALYASIDKYPHLAQYIQGHLPKEVLVQGHYNIDDHASHKLTFSSDTRLAFLAGGTHCLKVLSIENFSETSKLSSFETTEKDCELVDISLSKNHRLAYLSDLNNGFIIMDISDPNVLIIKSEFSKIKARTSLITKDDKTAFVVHDNRGFSILDISDKEEPKLLATYNYGLKVSSLAYDASRSLLYVTHDKGLSILDVSILGNPREVFLYPKDQGASHIALAIDKKIAYLSLMQKGVEVIDISDEKSIQHISNYYTPQSAYHLTLSPDAGSLFISAADDGVYHVDTKDLHDLRHVVTYKIKSPSRSNAIALSTTLNDYASELFISYENAGIAKVPLKK